MKSYNNLDSDPSFPLMSPVLLWYNAQRKQKSPHHAAAAAAAKSLQSCSTLQPHRWHTTRLLHPWDFPGESTRVGCHYLLCPSSWELNNGKILFWPWNMACNLNIYNSELYQIKKDIKGKEISFSTNLFPEFYSFCSWKTYKYTVLEPLLYHDNFPQRSSLRE